jgi:hypothetical protein
MASEVYLVTKANTADRWAFVNEVDILPSLELTYSTIDHVITKIDRTLYVARVTREDVINTDVFTVQRVPLLEAGAHL